MKNKQIRGLQIIFIWRVLKYALISRNENYSLFDKHTRRYKQDM